MDFFRSMRRQHSIHCKNNCVFLLVSDAKQDTYTLYFTKGNMFLEYEIKFYLSCGFYTEDVRSER